MFRFFRWQSYLVALLGLALGPAAAQQVSTSPHYTVQRWEAGAAEDGLPQNTVTAIVQTRDGYLWIGTYSGLARFDGLRFTVFDDNNSPGLASSRVTSLFEADDGTLWIGHESGEVSSYRQGRFQTAKVTANWSRRKIQELATDATGDVWLLNSDGLLARLRDGLVLTPESGDAASVVALVCSRSGKIWVGRNGRVSELRDGRLIPLAFTDATANRYVTGIGASRDNNLWVLVGQRVRKWKNQTLEGELDGMPWPDKPLLKLVETESGALLASTSDSGFALINSGTEAPLAFNRTNGFPSDWVTALCEDREGNFWIGTGGAGLAVLRRGIIQTVAPPDAWLGRAVLSVYPGRDASLWIGTEGAGLYQLRDRRWQRFAEESGIAIPYVWSVIEDARDGFWIGTWNYGLLTRRGDRFESAAGLEGMAEPITAMLRAGEGGLWLGTGAGLMRYDGGKRLLPGPGENPAKGDVRAIAEARDGNVWFGTSGGGLGRLRDGQVRWFHRADGLASEYIGCLHLEADDTLWIGTLGGGLNRFKDGRFAAIGREHGLPNGFITHIEDDGLGFFWMGSHNGLIRVAKAGLNARADGLKEVHFRTYGLSDGMPTLNCSSGLQAAGCKTADGRLWFSTSRGLVAVNPSNVRTNRQPPPVVVEHLLLNEKSVSFTNNATSPLRISPGRHRIEFQFSGLSFIGSERIQFKHRLENWENEWVNSGTKRAVNYNYLPPGDYRFEVAARNNDGVWSDQNAVVAFTVLPFFWQTLGFRVASAFLLVAGATAVVWFDTRRRMRRKLEILERQRAVESERARIAKDIHDDLGSTLTRITMLSDPVRGAGDETAAPTGNLHQIHTTARELTRLMDEIVWAINPQHDTLDSLMAYLESFAQDFLGTARVRCRFDVPLQFPVLPLTAEARHNLFLAFKEALHNVVKHSGATEVRISAGLTPTEFTLMLEDNGCGFSLPEAGRKGFGNGLANMRRRLARIGGQCEIAPVPGQGTKVTFIVKLGRPKAAGPLS